MLTIKLREVTPPQNVDADGHVIPIDPLDYRVRLVALAEAAPYFSKLQRRMLKHAFDKTQYEGIADSVVTFKEDPHPDGPHPDGYPRESELERLHAALVLRHVGHVVALMQRLRDCGFAVDIG